MSINQRQWGYLRESYKGVDKEKTESEVGYTPLSEYLKVIFPDTDDWIHNKSIKDGNGKSLTSCRPDFHSPSLKIVIEFDGKLHYQNPDQILKDIDNTATYKKFGYKVVRIPYFIQLSNKAISELFGIEVNEPMFDETYPSFGVKWNNTPAYMCPAGLCRMAKEFHRFPTQYHINLEALKKEENQKLSGTIYLEYFYQQTENHETI